MLLKDESRGSNYCYLNFSDFSEVHVEKP